MTRLDPTAPATAGGDISRRRWLQQAGASAASLALAPGRTLAQKSRSPNVILIVADDLGSRDIGCYGADDLVTPNIDGLAKLGVRFSQFYVTAAVCLPSRASLLTGRHYQRVMIDGVGLDGSEVTLAELLRAAGYRTALYGKWHLGHRKDVSPKSQGFDSFVGFKYGAIDNYSYYYYWGPGAKPAMWREDALIYEGGQHFSEVVANAAVQFISDTGDRPYFLYLPLNIPHYPLQPSAEDLERTRHITDLARRMYAAFVTTMDRCIGRVLKAVNDSDQTRDTIVIFLSDHGHSEEKDTLGGGGRSTPFRGGKGTFWEGGIRVPCIVTAWGRAPAGEVRHQLSSSLDLFPTIAEWCGVPLQGLEVDGRSLTQVIASAQAPSPHDHMVWQYMNWAAVRSGDWKFVADDKKDLHLYQLSVDPAESKNLFKSHPDQVRRLVDLHRAWVTEMREDPRTHTHLPPVPGQPLAPKLTFPRR
ncbi:MAG: sulfatase-like hydrolase/transferase [Candidatus Latescibacterota bacterium]|nr:sulfatase-like hydrolase/transferase [Candidatus Latescibacterota bacterium]